MFLLYSQYGQVGINTTNQNASLDVQSSNQVYLQIQNAVSIPKADNFPTSNPIYNI